MSRTLEGQWRITARAVVAHWDSRSDAADLHKEFPHDRTNSRQYTHHGH